MIGIYTIRNKVNNKIYIGASIDVVARMAAHKKLLSYGCHHSETLQHDYSASGMDSFLFEILEECDECILYDREMFWISKFKSCDGEYGYNKTKGGQGNRCNEDTRLKISNSLIGHGCSEETRRRIGIKTKLRTQGKNNPFYGRKHSDETKKYLSDINRGKKLSLETCLKKSASYNYEAHNKPIQQKSLDGTPIKDWISATNASRTLNIERRNIQSCCRGRRKSAGGYKWIYAEEYNLNETF
jgi:group I intron endonuclease